MSDTPAALNAVATWKIEKRQGGDAGDLFEVIEGGDDRPSVVTFRKPGIAPHESYAWDLSPAQAIEPEPVRLVTAIDTAALGTTDASQ
jgi:hypothetical protein